MARQDTEAELNEDLWTDPDLGRALFRDYSQAWTAERPDLRPNTVQVYEYLLGKQLLPYLGNRMVADIREAHVRRWRRELLDAGASAASVAKAYRLLKAIMNTAVDDGITRRNPCRNRGASQDRSPERPVLELREIIRLAEAIGDRHEALILLAVFGSLHWGELAELRRRDIDQVAGVAKVERSLTESPGGGYHFGLPKSAAGQRSIVIPAAIMATLNRHMAAYTALEPDALVFTSPTGAPLRHNNFRRRHWLPALAAANRTGIHFHDLRHTGNALAAGTRATLRELMDRMGHSSRCAALIYLHGSDAGQREIGKSLSKVAQRELRAARSGTQRARSASSLE